MIVHRVLIPLLEPWAFGAAGGALAFLCMTLVELAGKLQRRRQRAAALILEQYRAEASIRHLKRTAISELLEVDRDYRRAELPHDVIEGSAIEMESR